jgi:hypothetical protein
VHYSQGAGRSSTGIALHSHNFVCPLSPTLRRRVISPCAAFQAWCSHPPPSVLAAAKRAACSMLAADLSARAALLHTVMIRRTLFFPDRRLVQFDCGKLQELDVLLRRLHRGGHRVLIFTQMTKMLDILEQVHSHAAIGSLSFPKATLADCLSLVGRRSSSTFMRTGMCAWTDPPSRRAARSTCSVSIPIRASSHSFFPHAPAASG